jgi:hypothetical protein
MFYCMSRCYAMQRCFAPHFLASSLLRVSLLATLVGNSSILFSKSVILANHVIARLDDARVRSVPLKDAILIHDQARRDHPYDCHSRPKILFGL